jgi:hypothetical protein
MKNLIVFTLIFLFSNHLYAASGVPSWGQDTNCNSFFGKNKKWQHNGLNYLNFYKEASDKLAQQSALYNKFNYPDEDFQGCLIDNYGFQIPFEITNASKFRKFRLADKNKLKGIDCRVDGSTRENSQLDTNYMTNDSNSIYALDGTSYSRPTVGELKNEKLGRFSQDLQDLGRVSFEHYCAKNMMEAYSNYWAKEEPKRLKHCTEMNNSIDLSSISKADPKNDCADFVNNLKYAKDLTDKYIKYNDGLTDDHKKLMNFDDNLYKEFKNDMNALQVATDTANKKMELTENVLVNGLDKVANCLDSTGVDSFIIDSFKDSGCGNNLYDEMMSSVTLQDISKVIDGIKNDYTSDFAKQANEVSFKKGLETFFKYASDDLKNVMSNEKAFCQLIQGFNKSASIGDAGGGEWDVFENKKFDDIIKNFDKDNGTFPTSQNKEHGNMVDRVEIAKGHSFSVRGGGLVCDERSALKTPYKKMFQGLKEKSANNSPTNEEVKDDINKFLNEVNKDCNELLKYPYTSVCSNCSDNSDIARTQEQIITDVTDYPKRLEYETSIKEKYFKFMSDHKNSTTHLAMLDLVSKKSKDFADTFKTLSDSFWGTGEITTHDQMGFCNSRYKNGKDSLMTPDDYGIDEEDVKKLKRELDYQLLRGVAESDDIPSGPGIYNCGDDPREALRLYKLFMSYPRSLRALLDKAEDASQKMLFTKSICDSVNCINNNRDDTVAVLTTTSNAISLVEGYAHSANKAAGAALRVAKLVVDVSKNRFLYGISEEKLNTLTLGALNDEYNDEEAVFNALVESIDNMQELDDELTKIFSDFAKKEAFTQGIPVLSKKLTDQEFMKTLMKKVDLSKYTEKVFEKLGISGLDKGMKEKFVSSYIKSLRNAIENYDDPTNLVLGEVVQSVSRARYGKLVQVERMKKIKDTMEKTGQTVFEIKGTRFTTDEWSKRIVDAENGINSDILSSKFVRGHARTSKKVIKSLPPINNTNSDNDKN